MNGKNLAKNSELLHNRDVSIRITSGQEKSILRYLQRIIGTASPLVPYVPMFHGTTKTSFY